MKIARFKNKDMKPKYIQTEFACIEHMDASRRFEPEYTPPEPKEMTNEELEKWYIVSPSKKLKSEILARMNKGAKFSRFRAVQYLGMTPKLVPVFRDETNMENKIDEADTLIIYNWTNFYDTEFPIWNIERMLLRVHSGGEAVWITDLLGKMHKYDSSGHWRGRGYYDSRLWLSNHEEVLNWIVKNHRNIRRR